TRFKVAALALTLALTGLGTWSLSPRPAAPVHAAPAPKGKDEQPFARIDPNWRVQRNVLEPHGDLPDSFTVINPDRRDLSSYVELRYFEADKKHPRRILRYHPNGRLVSEIDNVGK